MVQQGIPFPTPSQLTSAPACATASDASGWDVMQVVRYDIRIVRSETDAAISMPNAGGAAAAAAAAGGGASGAAAAASTE